MGMKIWLVIAQIKDIFVLGVLSSSALSGGFSALNRNSD